MKAQRRLLIAGIVVSSLLTLSPLVGLLGTFLGMTRAFRTLEATGVADPQVLSSDIGSALVSTAAGLLLLPVGLVGLTLSLFLFYRLRASTPPPLPPLVQQPTE